MKSFSAIEKLLEEETGLDSNSIGRNVVQRVVKSHMESTGIIDVDGYYDKLKRDKIELQALIEDVTVPETWFFRDQTPFDLLTKVVRAEWFPPSQGRPLRILSVPCATGEEAYSIAMVMRSLGFDSSKVRIDAVDISKRALARASDAIYGENSFRGDEGSYKSRYFDKTDLGYRLRDYVREMVKFCRGNLLADDFLAGAELYDVVFCRNVMIYFSQELRGKAIKKLHRLLSVNGLLFVGHAEAASLGGELFVPVKHSGAFAFRKKSASSSKGENSEKSPKSVKTASSMVSEVGIEPLGKRPNKKRAKRHLYSVTSQGNDRHTHAVAAANEAINDPVLQEVRRLADEGRLDDAASLCEDYLENNAVNAEAHYLMGLIRHAEEKEVDANNHFRKAVYLNPRHYDALVHLAALSEAEGNQAAAAVYRARAARLIDKD